MTTLTRLSAILAITTLVFAPASFAQEGTTGLVTVLDVAKVFEQNPTFNGQMEQIKAEAENLKKSIQSIKSNNFLSRFKLQFF